MAGWGYFGWLGVGVGVARGRDSTKGVQASGRDR